MTNQLKLPELPQEFPFTSPAMVDAAVFLADAIKQAHQGKARFVLFGDFDVDGTSSAAIMSLYLKLYGVDGVTAFVSRRKDGYGLSQKSLARLKNDIVGLNFSGTTYVVLMDLGVSTTKEAEALLSTEGLIGDVGIIVIDHHVPTPSASAEWDRLKSAFPGKVCAYDPLLCEDEDDRYFRCLSAAGLVQRINEVVCDADIHGLGAAAKSKAPLTIISNAGVKKIVSRRTILNTIDKIAAIAQASDVMPFAMGGKLTTAWQMAKKFEDSSGTLLPGVSELYKKTNTASRIGWVIGPILNAAGRLEDAFAAYDLMTEISDQEALEKMSSIEETRTRVQSITSDAWTVMDEMVQTSQGVCVVVLDKERVGPGIVGIAASKACDKYGRPSVCLVDDVTEDGVQILKGSMRRGNTDFSCEAWILLLKEKGIAIAGGGHPAAAGMTILKSRYQEFIDNAETQIYSNTAPATTVISPHQAKEHLRLIESIMPFGNGNMPPKLRVSGMLSAVRPLMRKADGMIWCCILNVSEEDDLADFVEIKVMAKDLSADSLDMLMRIADKPLRLPITIDFEAFDGYRAGYGQRGEFRAVTSIRSDLSIKTAPVQWLDLTRDTESKSFAHLAIHAASPSLVPNNEEGDEVEVLGASQHNDIAMIARLVEKMTVADRHYKITCVVDTDPRLSYGLFLLKRPPKHEIESAIGEDGLEALSAAHGGRWDAEMKGFVISAASVPTLKPHEGGLYTFLFTKRTLGIATNIDEANKRLLDIKSNPEPFLIPFLAPDKTPFGFQFADVRYFLTKPVSLCYNDMGTGKTFEAAIWGIMRYASSILAPRPDFLSLAKADLSSVCAQAAPLMTDTKSGKRCLKGANPILVTTMSSIANQFAKELESFLTIGAVVVSTDTVNELLSKVKKVGKKGRGETSNTLVHPSVLEEFKNKIIEDNAFVVVTYDCLSRHPWIVSAIDWGGIVCDEAHELKGANTLKTRAVFGEKIDLSPLRRQNGIIPILAMSGTFPKNRPGDWFVWTRITNADGGVYTSGTVSDAQRKFDRRFDGLTYKEIWLKRGGIRKKVIIPDKGPPENGDELKSILAPYVVRRLKDEINDLPPMYMHVRRIPSSGLYLDILSNIRTGINLKRSSQELLNRYGLLSASGDFKGEDPEDLDNKSTITATSLAGKLSMISSLDKAAGILGTLSSLEWIGPKSDGTPFVLIAFHRSAVKELARQMEIAGIEYFSMTQEDSIEQREAKKTAFQNGERQAFITTYGVGGTGLNLTRASKLCLVNLPWIEGAVSQAISRTWRAGQKSACTTVILLQAGSIDESTYYLIKNKGRANFKTAGVDQMRRQGGKLPGWAIGSILDFEQTDTIKADTSGEDADPNKDNEPINKTGWLS